MIDLHCHILHGLDDGPATIEESLAMARVAESAGTETIVATPHIREDHPFELGEIAARADLLNGALREEGIGVAIETGGEVAPESVADLHDHELRGLCYGRGRYLLLESPYVHATGWLEEIIEDLQRRGFRIVLAHPERCPSFHRDPARLAALADRGALCSVTAMSLRGQFGRRARDFSLLIFREGLLHNVASDAHDAHNRPPSLRPGFEALARGAGGREPAARWLCGAVPRAVLEGVDAPGPLAPREQRPGLGKLLRPFGRGAPDPVEDPPGR